VIQATLASGNGHTKSSPKPKKMRLQSTEEWPYFRVPILSGFLHFQQVVEHFDERVLPLVRELEARSKATKLEVVFA
jgi:hypothetical protein